MKQSELKKRRLAMKLTQARAAELLGVALRTYSYWEKCAYKIPKLKMLAIANILGK